MAIAATYNTAGDREDLTNALTILTPEDCPKTSTFSKSTDAFNMLHEWQMDTLLPVSFPGVVEGADVSSFTDQVAQRARVGNRVVERRVVGGNNSQTVDRRAEVQR